MKIVKLSAHRLTLCGRMLVPFLFLLCLLPLDALEEYRLTAEADTFVDPPLSIPQGSSGSLAVSYDPSFGTVARSYLRFDLSGVGTELRVLSARLDLLATLAVGGGGSFDLHRCEQDNWNEALVTWSGRPAFDPAILGTATVTGYGPIHQPVGVSFTGWDILDDRQDGKVTFVLKARGTTTVGGINFSSREGSSAPALALFLRERGEWYGGDFENGLDPSVATGDVSLVADPGDPSNTVVQLSTHSPATLSQEVDTPRGLFGLTFSADFLSSTGTFSILINDREVACFDAPGGLPGGMLVDDRSLRGLNDAVVTFRLDGPDGTTSTLILDDIAFFELPEPPLSIALDAGGEEVILSFPAEEGASYQIWHSANLTEWNEFGRTVGPLGLDYETRAPIGGNAGFFRLETLAGPDAGATDAGILNASFEDPVLGDNANTSNTPDWVSSAGAGIWNPPPAQYGGVAPADDNVAYVHNGNSLSQTLTEVLEPYRLYTLELWMGRRTDIGWPTASGPTVTLSAGGVALAPARSSTPLPASGEFEFWSIDYIIGREHPQLGEALMIVIDGGTSAAVSQVNCDDVVLEVR